MQPTTPPLSSVTIDNLTTPAAIQAVIDNPNWVIRNLQITQSYHELNLAVDRYLAAESTSAWTVAIYLHDTMGAADPCGHKRVTRPLQAIFILSMVLLSITAAAQDQQQSAPSTGDL